MGKGKAANIDFSKALNRYANDIKPYAKSLKLHNEQLDAIICDKLYECFQTKGSLKVYRKLAKFMDRNNYWYDQIIGLDGQIGVSAYADDDGQ